MSGQWVSVATFAGYKCSSLKRKEGRSVLIRPTPDTYDYERETHLPGLGGSIHKPARVLCRYLCKLQHGRCVGRAGLQPLAIVMAPIQKDLLISNDRIKLKLQTFLVLSDILSQSKIKENINTQDLHFLRILAYDLS